jgi:glycogen(starch) synthase
VRILVISNSYPPYHKSGYASGCLDIVEGLKARGHQVQVLTSAPESGQAPSADDIHRRLTRDSPKLRHWHDVFLKEVINQTVFRNLSRDFEPDLVFLFDLSGISVSLAMVAQEEGRPVCFYVANDWLAAWERDLWYRSWPKEEGGFRVLRFLSRRFELVPPAGPLDLAHVVFSSAYLKDMSRHAGPAGAAVIPWGIDVRRFAGDERPSPVPSRLLYVGKIGPQKGLDIAIEALSLLKGQYGCKGLTLTIAGDDRAFPDFAAYLRDLAAWRGVLHDVSLAGWVPREKMPGLYRTHNILVFPSVLEEPLTISLLEAMSCGMAVVSTATGGNAEILTDEVNALVIPRESPRQCAEKVLRLLREPELLESLGAKARRTVEEGFAFESSLDALEQVLLHAASRPAARSQRPVPKEARTIPERMGRESAGELSRRARKWLKYGDLVVLSRALLKPDFLMAKLKAAFQKSSSYVALLVFPVLYETFFLLSGRRKKSSPRVSLPERVLVVQPADIGDILLSGPFLRELRRFLPRAEIHLAVQPRMLNLVEKCPYVDAVIPFDWRRVKDWKTAFRGHVRWWLDAGKLARHSLWKHRFDTAISLRWNNDAPQAASLILMYVSGAPRRIAYINGPDDFLFLRLGDVNRLTTAGPARGAPKHEVERQLDILRFLGGHPENAGLEVWTTEEDERFARHFLSRSGLTGKEPLVAMAPGAAWGYRRWPVGRFIEVGRWLQENFGASILIVASRSELDLAFQVEKGLHRDRAFNLAGRTTLREMAAVLKRCRLFVGNDSGPMHVAAASGVPSVGLFGPGEYERFRPWGPGHEVVRLGFTCNPCSENCQFNEPRCILGITVEQVKAVLAGKIESWSDLK